jgi:Domain of unknown function (DUF4340)
MNARLVRILVIALIVIGGGALWMYQKERAVQPPAVAILGEPLLGGLQAANVAEIRIVDPGGKITLRRDGPHWVIAERGDFPADFAKVRNFVLAALALKTGQTDPIGPADRTRLRLDDPAAKESGGTLVEFAAADGKPLARLIVGRKYFKTTPENPERAKADGRFVLRPDAENGGATAIIVADPLEQAGIKPSLWIERRALAASEPVSIDVRHADGDHWRLERGKGSDAVWKLDGAKPGEKLTETTVLSIVAAAGGLDIADIVEGDPQRVAKELAKATVITVVTRDGLTYTLKVGSPEDQKQYAVATIEGSLPEAREPVAGEKPEEAAARDKAFAGRIAAIRARQPSPQALARFAFLVPEHTLVDLTKKRADLLEKPPAKKP